MKFLFSFKIFTPSTDADEPVEDKAIYRLCKWKILKALARSRTNGAGAKSRDKLRGMPPLITLTDGVKRPIRGTEVSKQVVKSVATVCEHH